MILAALLLLAALGGVWWFQRGDLGEYRRFCALDDGHSRRMRFRLWLVRAALVFLLPVLAGLVLLGRMGALAGMPGEFVAVAGVMPSIADDDGTLSSLLIGGAVGGLVTGVLVARFRRRRPIGNVSALLPRDRREVKVAVAGVMPSIADDDGTLSSLLIGGAVGGLVTGVLVARFRRRRPIGNVSALLPRDRREVKYALALSVMAGVTEEAFFRLYLPLLIAMLTGQAWVGFAASLVLFGAMHRYQGWTGVLATTALGAVMTGLYLMTGSLWVVMLVHTLVDVNALVVAPVMNGALKT